MIKELKNQFSWSKSRDDTFNECRRRYYYSYYGYWGGWKINAPEEVREIYVLKQLKNRYMWTGGIVHDAVSGVLGTMKTGTIMPMERLLDSARTRMREEFKSSRDKCYWDKPKTCALFEHEYASAVSDGEWLRMWEHVESCIRNFYDSDIFAAIKKIEPARWLPIEEFQELLFEGTRIIVKMDFSYKEGEDGVTIIDWKTGKSESTTGDVQLLCYALFAASAWDVDMEKIKTVEYNLVHKKATESRLNTAKMDFARNFIKKSIGGMKALIRDTEENRVEMDDFPRTENVSACNSCNFRKVCKP